MTGTVRVLAAGPRVAAGCPQDPSAAAVAAAMRAVAPVPPFDPARVALVTDVARRLSRGARGDGSAQALAFWLRTASVARMRAEFEALDRPDAVLVPRGLVFQIPPANVDTLFGYGLAIALLLGNTTIVRVPARLAASSGPLLTALGAALADHPTAADAVALVAYGHDPAVTDAFSAACDLRVVWGGDRTVDAIRRSPLPPRARDVTFGDRQSLAVLDGSAYAGLDAAGRDALAAALAQDIAWFDQLACSSPRAVVWIRDGRAPGEVRDGTAGGLYRLEEDFYRRVGVALMGHSNGSPAAALQVARLAEAYGALADLPAAALHPFGPGLAVVDTAAPGLAGASPADASTPPAGRFVSDVLSRSDFCGGGLLYHVRVGELAELVPLLGPGHQTLAVFGVCDVEVRSLVRALVGRAVDRIVPFGRALAFDRFWDGYDLFAEFTRRVAVSPVESRPLDLAPSSAWVSGRGGTP